MIHKVEKFLAAQIAQIRHGGSRVLVRKGVALCRKLARTPIIFLAVPCVLLIRALRPIIIIRLIDFDVGRIGHLCNADNYLSFQHAGKAPKRSLDAIYFYTSTNGSCNQHYEKMWRRVLRTAPFERFLSTVNDVNRWIPGYESHVKPRHLFIPITEEGAARNKELVKCILTCKKPHIAFTPEEEVFGEKALRELGVPGGIPFICFHARDSAYLDGLSLKKDWKYHDFRDSNIHNYVPAAEEMVRRGHYAVRMGAAVKERLSPINTAIIDYAGDGRRTDFLDIYLTAKSRFLLCSDTGFSSIAEVFRRPTVYVNTVYFALLYRLWARNALFVFKKYHFSTERRLLTFPEIIHSEILTCSSGIELEKMGVTLIENTPEEISAAAVEMDERLKGIWKTTEEDEDLQARFWALFRPGMLKSPSIRIGAQFLRDNRELLPPA